MRTHPLLAVAIVTLAGSRLFAASPTAAAGALVPVRIRPPAVQGSFYPGSARELQTMVDGLLAAPADTLPPGRVRAVIAPHAGYVYSGPVAARALRLVPATTRRVIILAPSHRVALRNGAIARADAFRTALGEIPLDPACDTLCATPALIRRADEPHAQEHSLEVMLPFLQRHLKRFSLVPIVLGQTVDSAALAQALAPLLDDPDTALVFSTDLSHYHPDATARQLDERCIAAILKLDSAALFSQELCGKAPVAVALQLAALRRWQPVRIAYQTSGDTAGDKEHVVGYTAIAFLEPAPAPSPEPVAPPAPAASVAANLVPPAERRRLLALARETILARLAQRPLPPLPTGAPVLAEKLGCFVTLHLRGDLRGCIGNITPVHPLAQAVQNNAISAAFQDPRFTPVTAAEMAAIDLEISVLSLPRPLPFADADDLLRQLRPGVHGVVLSEGIFRQATFLPQVWEQLPDKVQFLEHLCRKGGMARDAWRDPARVEVKTYEALVFGEKTAP